ncbi:MAG TPA: DNA mismatch repair endonuclease MutL [Bacteroidales bacterium]|nr:DNA mismatch repair endonuclease MutL [Bacteroidales bacterium]
MEGIIKLLPDLVANQIAAGEVIQRPASAVKEILENAVDANATMIELWISEAGKKLIMVVDNGKGMSPADCRLCFERHATSKIERSDDLFRIRTLGFRGEALASVAAVAQVELKSRREEDELATVVRIEGGKFISQEPDAHAYGTTLSVKNLFYNVPARRNFLKGNNLEFKHIVEEFSRVALANEAISFRMFNDGRELYHLPASNLKQRIVNLFGNHYNSRLVPVGQETDIVNISGFIGKPEFAKKNRGEQYFFVNGRYFRHSYLQHAVLKAYQELIHEGSFPSWFLFFTIDPSQVDVNIHPTKTEVNFIENQSIYAILHTAVRNALGKYNLTPSIDFDTEPIFTPHISPNREIRIPTISSNPDYNPFNPGPAAGRTTTPGMQQGRQTSLLHQRGWEKLYAPAPLDEHPSEPAQQEEGTQQEPESTRKFFQLHQTWIITTIKSGMLMVHQQHAHQRILYEKYLEEYSRQQNAPQKLLFPISIQLTPEEAHALASLKEKLQSLGFEWYIEDEETFFNATPCGLKPEEVAETIGFLISEWNEEDTGSDAASQLAGGLASRKCIKTGTPLSEEQMEALVSQLFSTSMPGYTSNGKKTHIILPFDELQQRFSG